MKDVQTIYQETIKYAGGKHAEKDQKIPGTDLPYIVHVCNVTMEVMMAHAHEDNFDLPFAVTVALLHDTVEDTATTVKDVHDRYGREVSEAVSALTKNEELPKDKRMQDSLDRIKPLRKEAGIVKLADRITNLQQAPKHWDDKKKKEYREESEEILEALRHCNDYLAKRLEKKIKEYS